MQLVVIPPVLELLANAFADFEVVVGRDGHVAAVEEFVDVGAEEDAVVDRVLLDVGVVADVGGFEDGERPLAGNRAAALVRVEDRTSPSRRM